MASRERNLETIVASESISHERIDAWLASQDIGLSRTQIKNLILEKSILLNGEPCRAKDHIAPGDTISYPLGHTSKESLSLKAAPLDLDILFEDEDLIVINKVPGVVVHPGAGTKRTTLIEGILHYLGEKHAAAFDDGELRPGVVHRLDKDTSGAIVFAKNQKVLQGLSKQFADKTNVREYVALLNGRLTQKELLYSSYLHKCPTNRLKYESLTSTEMEEKFGEEPIPSSFRFSKSEFIRRKVYADRLTLARVRLFTGRTHQIRIHASAMNMHVVGDLMYGSPVQLPQSFPETIRERVKGIKRQMLHARILGFTHPVSGKKLAFEAVLPEDFKALLEDLDHYSHEI